MDQLAEQPRVEAERAGEPQVLATGADGLRGQDPGGQVVRELAERLAEQPGSFVALTMVGVSGQQKALWLMGIAATQAGEDEAAISYWETLVQQLEPDSGSAQSVQQQIGEAQGLSEARVNHIFNNALTRLRVPDYEQHGRHGNE